MDTSETLPEEVKEKYGSIFNIPPKKAPFAVFDTETTGKLDHPVFPRMLEICIVLLNKKKERMGVWTKKCNPGMAIPEDASRVHNIYDKDVEGEEKFRELAPKISALLNDRVLIAYNIDYDIAILDNEFSKIKGSVFLPRDTIDVMKMDRDRRWIKLVTAAEDAGIQWEGEAHSAEADTLATADLFTKRANKKPINILQNEIPETYRFGEEITLKDDIDCSPCDIILPSTLHSKIPNIEVFRIKKQCQYSKVPLKGKKTRRCLNPALEGSKFCFIPMHARR